MGKKRLVGLIGCGWWGRNILRDLVSLACEVVAVSRSEASRTRAREGGASTIVESVEALPEVDGVVVATSSTSHASVVEALLERQIPIFVEKPMTVDAESAVRLAEAASDRLFVMHKWRYHPGIERLAEIAASRELGQVIGLRTVRVGWTSIHRDEDPIWYLAPHDLSICLAILGEIPSPRAAVIDHFDGQPTGMLATLGDEPWFVFEVSARCQTWRREVRLQFEQGFAVLPGSYSDHLQVVRGPVFDRDDVPEPETISISTEMPLLRELRAFIKHLGGGPPPRSSAAEGAAVVKAIADLRRLAGLSGRARGVRTGCSERRF